MTSRMFGVDKTAFQKLAKGDPCPSILCQRIHRPEPDNIGYLKAQESSDGCPIWQVGHTFH